MLSRVCQTAYKGESIIPYQFRGVELRSSDSQAVWFGLIYSNDFAFFLNGEPSFHLTAGYEVAEKSNDDNLDL